MFIFFYRRPMHRDALLGNAIGRLRSAPPLVRDMGAVLSTVGLFIATAWMPQIGVPLSFLLVGVGLLLAALIFGRASAILAALLTAIVVRFWPSGVAAEEAGTTEGFLLLSCLLAAGMGASAVLEALRRHQAEARLAYSTMDVAVRAATERLEQARARLREAEAQVEEARRNSMKTETVVAAPDMLNTAGRRAEAEADTFETALRSEGGV